MTKKETLNDIYQELLSWLEYEGKPSERIWHPLFHTYPWGLRFELGACDLEDTAEYIRSAKDRGRRIWDAVFAPEDDVLVIFDTTPDKRLSQELKTCQSQRVRGKRTSPFPGDTAEEGEAYFYRSLYRAPAKEIPFDAILGRIVEEQTRAGGPYRYSSNVYFSNRSKKLLFHPYDDRGADLIGPDRETLRPYYKMLNDLLLDWNREDMDRKWRVRRLRLRILTATTAPGTEEKLRTALEQRLQDAVLTCSALEPYWKNEGWGEMNVTMETSLTTGTIRRRLASRWEADTAAEGIRLPNAAFLWLTE